MDAFQHKVRQELKELGFDFDKMITVVNDYGIWASELIPMHFVSNHNDFLKFDFQIAKPGDESMATVQGMDTYLVRKTSNNPDDLQLLASESFHLDKGPLQSREIVLNQVKDLLAIMRVREKFGLNQAAPKEGNQQTEANQLKRRR